MPVLYSVIPSPLGDLLLLGNGEALTGLYLPDPEAAVAPPTTGQRDDEAFSEARRQLDAYFAGELTRFELPLAPAGTDFQQRAWRALLDIPYGDTRSYRQQAEGIGSPKAVRAIGRANGCNPIAIVVPCHRVIGSNGQLTGYAGGLERKRWLLAHEARHRANSRRGSAA